MRNEYEIRGDITAILLKRKNGECLETLIDTDDLEKVEQFPFTWFAHWDKSTKGFYVEGKIKSKEDGKRKTYSLHRWIMQSQEGYEVDHIFHDTLDNRRKNLRVLKKGFNQQNYAGARTHNKSSGIRGVSWVKKLRKWRASFRLDGTTYHVGVYADLNDAERAIILARAKYMEYSNDRLIVDKGDLNNVFPCFETGLSANNTSGYNGLVFDKKIKKWQGRKTIKGKIYHTKYYSNKEDAHNKLQEIIKEVRNEDSDIDISCIS